MSVREKKFLPKGSGLAAALAAYSESPPVINQPHVYQLSQEQLSLLRIYFNLCYPYDKISDGQEIARWLNQTFALRHIGFMEDLDRLAARSSDQSEMLSEIAKVRAVIAQIKSEAFL